MTELKERLLSSTHRFEPWRKALPTRTRWSEWATIHEGGTSDLDAKLRAIFEQAKQWQEFKPYMLPVEDPQPYADQIHPNLANYDAYFTAVERLPRTIDMHDSRAIVLAPIVDASKKTEWLSKTRLDAVEQIV